MSISELDMKVKELRELKRIADEVAGEIEALQDGIKAHMTEQNTDAASVGMMNHCKPFILLLQVLQRLRIVKPFHF